MKRFVVDLTEFSEWSGHLTGIQRVSRGIAESFEDTENVVLVTFDGKDAFHEVQYDDFKERFEVHDEAKSLTETVVGVDVGNRHRMKLLAKKIYYRMPGGVRQSFTPERRERIKRAAVSVNRILSRIRAGKTEDVIQVDLRVPFMFKKGDIMISSCRAWDHPNYLETVQRLRVENGIVAAFVIYDLIPIYQQHTFGPGLTERYTEYLYEVLRGADYLLPISNSSKRDILRFADEIGLLKLPVINTIRLGDDIAKEVTEEVPKFVRNKDSFALTVGTIEARKNHAEIYYAYKLAAERGIKLPEIYIVGGKGWLTDDIIYMIENDLDTKDRIIFLRDVSDRNLAWLYKNALFTVYPSQYEGWGLPIAESLSYGTPCIASTTSSMTEIAPRYVDHVSPFDPAELLGCMERYADPLVSQKRRDEILIGYKPYTWRDTYDSIRKALN